MNTETNQKEAYIAPEITIVDVVYESIICESYPKESGDLYNNNPGGQP